MEVLPQTKRLALLEFLHHIKYALNEWLIVETRLTDMGALQMNSTQVADILNRTFQGKDGRLLVCNDHEVLMLIRWGKAPAKQLTQEVRTHLPETVCEIDINPPTKEGLVRIEMRLAPRSAETELYEERTKRHENVIMIVDDDLFVRKLLQKALEGVGRIVETADGNQAVALYLANNPDVVILDIHLPGLYGNEVLKKLQTVDRNSFIIMHSADSSKDNIIHSVHDGAKGFLAKPFAKNRLIDVVKKCSTIT